MKRSSGEGGKNGGVVNENKAKKEVHAYGGHDNRHLI